MIQVISPSRAGAHTYTRDMLLCVPFYSAMLLVPHMVVLVIFTSEIFKNIFKRFVIKVRPFESLSAPRLLIILN